MANYEYKCSCGLGFDVYKTITDIETLELCPSCGMILDSSYRLISRVHFMGEKTIDPYFCPGLGCVVESVAHRKRLARSKGLEEVGNEPVDNIIRRDDNERESRSKARWESLTKPTEVSSWPSTNSCTSPNPLPE